ncbi:MAG: ATP-binding cassette domain-containing protein [Deltaproteobacteria bacterium]|nr:ATP-binding cassette domain-containing protein [Deltaproteobacteria bacterium]
MISVQNLTKHYRVHSRAAGVGAAFRSLFHRTYDTVRAVDGVSFQIAPGERVGFLGPNGAGKTTTLKMLSGLLRPTSGELSVLGYVPGTRDAAFLRSIMLVTGQKQQLLWDLPPSETFELNRAVYDVPRDEFTRTRDELIAVLDLGKLIGRPTRQLSLGERMKCELCAALLHRPKILFLDEPTIGLDVTMQGAVRAFIKSYNEKNDATVLLTSHYMEDVAALCPRVVVIDHGKLIYDGALPDLVRRVRPHKQVTLRLAKPVRSEDLAVAGATLVKNEGESVRLDVAPDSLSATVAALLGKLPVIDLSVADPPIEEVLSDLFERHEASERPS